MITGATILLGLLMIILSPIIFIAAMMALCIVLYVLMLPIASAIWLYEKHSYKKTK